MLKIYSKLWGKSIKNKEENIFIYNLENEFLKIEVLNIGACLKKIELKDEEMKNKNLVVSYDKIEDYEKNPAYIGAIVGRNAGRIENGLLKIDEKIYELTKNNGNNNLHGGFNSISHRLWQVEIKEDRLSCFIECEHLENGYPGNLKIRVDYILNNNELSIEYYATSDRKTYVNLTNHSYFNLSGKKDDLIYENILELNSNYMLKINESSVPYELMKLKNTIFDFSKAKKIKSFFDGEHEQKKLANNGTDHPFILNKNQKNQIVCLNEQSKIKMEVETDNPAVVIYTANYFNDIGLRNHSAICFETQEVPNLFENEELNIYPTFIDEKNPYKKYTKFKFFKI